MANRFFSVGEGLTFTQQPSALGLTGRSSSVRIGDHNVMASATYANQCTGVGWGALTAVTTGSDNTCVGVNSGYSITSGTQNVCIGVIAGYKLGTGNGNVAVGYYTFGGSNTTGAYNNVAVGYYCLSNMGSNAADVQDNVAVGAYALQSANAFSNQNTAVGAYAGGNASTGLSQGSNITCIGYNANPSTTTSSNQITLGNSSVTSLRCQVTSITALSDARDKTDIEDSPHGLALIKKLRPVTFTWNQRDGERTGLRDLGFIAQDLMAVEDECGDADVLQLSLRDNPDKLEASPSRLIPVLVKAVQELAELVERSA